MDNFDLEFLVERTLLAAEGQTDASVEEFINYRIKNAFSIFDSIYYFRCFENLIWKKIKYLLENNIHFEKDEFLYVFSTIVDEAKANYMDKKYLKNSSKHKFKSEIYEFAYHEVYCNAYLRYSFTPLFASNNKHVLDKIKKYNIDNIIDTFDKYIDIFTISKLRFSYGEDYGEKFDNDKEEKIKEILELMKKKNEENEKMFEEFTKKITDDTMEKLKNFL